MRGQVSTLMERPAIGAGDWERGAIGQKGEHSGVGGEGEVAGSWLGAALPCLASPGRG